ncbi:hypothetical protein ACOMICROBIO_FLGHMIGD_03946 [Vibrio sp. B1FLJ16]|uniref:hypothetical protein n=1 Tax=Vibrio sp. B1FLJ16 TaxID=2751178 RepID=UPI0015F64E72|nr:hypothetical protein [Vibrio sp. B1FLJ16]CAD7819527.1 hypothetical protein ACOMICROBIO_FLGHMIGD_03946 [Vibrio sp. B1FLJ16]CAE6939233.1 hypothetical protein ACOMICROBIO_FLGHMIGD_03946 [Vibrio sp. B1FLJ16]
MRKKSVLLYTLIALSISACNTKIVSDRYIVDRTVMLTDKEGGPIPPLCKEDTISENQLGSSSPKKTGMVIKPGDVIHLAIWSPGRMDQGSKSKDHISPPSYNILRLPIRKFFVPESPEGEEKKWFEVSVLNDIERLVLANALTTNRNALLGDNPSREWIQKYMVEYEAALWNAFVDSMRIRRVDLVGKIKDCTDNGKARELTAKDMEYMRQSIVSLTFDMSKLLGSLEENDSAVTSFKKAFDFENKAADILGFKESASTPYSALAGKKVQAKDRNQAYYLTPFHPAFQSFLNLVSVEVNGIDFRMQQMPERAWSLHDVEASGICGDGAKIRAFTFRNDRTFSVANYSEKAGYEVKRLNENRIKNNSEQDKRPYQVGTQIGPKKKGLLSIFAVNSIHRYDLTKIYISDIEQIVWEGIPEKGDIASLRARCLMD